MVYMIINFNIWINKILKIRTAIDNVTGRLAEYDDKYVKMVRRNGDCVYIAISDILYVSPVKRQPDIMV